LVVAVTMGAWGIATYWHIIQYMAGIGWISKPTNT